MEEIWKDIEGYEKIYQISNMGRVRSFYYHNFNKVIILKAYKTKSGYLMVGLRKDGKRKHHLIHRLVAKSFIENPKNKSQVNHKNGVKEDNEIQNLEWTTQSENSKHAVKKGLFNINGLKKRWKDIKEGKNITNGEKSGNSKLKAVDVINIRERYLS